MKAKFLIGTMLWQQVCCHCSVFHLVERTDRGVMNLCSMVLHLQPLRRKEILRQRMVLL